MLMRLARAAVAALCVSVMFALAPAASPVVHGAQTTCTIVASATAAAYDGSLSGAYDAETTVNGYSADDCVALAQTFGVNQAGLACVNAGIPAGVVSGLGYAIVTWSTNWADDSGSVVSVGPIQQQYDCGDTFD